MDFTSKIIHGSASLPRPNAAKGTSRPGKIKFKSSSTTSANATLQETSALQTFAVTALDTTFLDLSREAVDSQKIAYGHELLDKLEQLKANILSGTQTKEDIIALSQCLTSQISETNDTKLNEILKQIKIRVAVELAKFGFDSEV